MEGSNIKNRNDFYNKGQTKYQKYENRSPDNYRRGSRYQNDSHNYRDNKKDFLINHKRARYSDDSKSPHRGGKNYSYHYNYNGARGYNGNDSRRNFNSQRSGNRIYNESSYYQESRSNDHNRNNRGYKNYKDNKVNYHSNTRYEEKNHIYPGYDRRFDNKDYYRKKKIEHYSRDDKRNRHKQEYYREYHNRNKNKYENNRSKYHNDKRKKKFHRRDRSKSESRCLNRGFHRRKSIDLKRFDNNHAKEIEEWRKEHKKDNHHRNGEDLKGYKQHVKAYRPDSSKKITKKESRSKSSYVSRDPHYSNSKSVSKKSSSSSSPSSSKSDEGHFKYKVGEIINKKYKILEFLGDGTFGRVLECKNLENGENYAIKVIRPVERYIESAQIEAEIIEDIMKKDIEGNSHCVKMLEHFYFEDSEHKYIALVFEKLAKSLYDFIKSNKYRGYPMPIIQSFARQILQGISFMHEKLNLTHTDLKPENLLLKHSKNEVIKTKSQWPKHILKKENRGKSGSPSTRSYSRDNKDKELKEEAYYYPSDSTIKIIDFGGATYKDERHSDVINTRQYRAPEVILSCMTWNEKSDVWSIACILCELYTGELLFPTHDSEEHLTLIERLCGPIPFWMGDNCKSEFKKLFMEKPDPEIEKSGHRVNFNKLKKRESVEEAVESLDTLDDLIHEDHTIFKDFIKSLLVIDPEIRPSCSESLRHEFFKNTFSN